MYINYESHVDVTFACLCRAFLGPVVGGALNDKLHFDKSSTIVAFLVIFAVSRKIRAYVNNARLMVCRDFLHKMNRARSHVCTMILLSGFRDACVQHPAAVSLPQASRARQRVGRP